MTDTIQANVRKNYVTLLTEKLKEQQYEVNEFIHVHNEITVNEQIVTMNLAFLEKMLQN